MSALSFFAPRSLPPDLAAKTRSLTCLSLLCFALADVRDGLGPFLGIFLQSHGWTPDSIGYVMTIGGLAGMAVTAPLGALADATRRKRLLLALPLRGCIAGFWHSPWSIIPVQMLDGVGAGILGVVTPGLAARLLNGTGHVNLGLGVIMTLQGIGASCSASYGGLVAHLLGYGPAFLALAAAPCVALGILLAGVRRLPRLHHALHPLEDS